MTFSHRKKPELSTTAPSLESLPPSSVPPHLAVFINEPKLSDFKLVLINAGVPCEFVGGVLICNNQVLIIFFFFFYFFFFFFFFFFLLLLVGRLVKR